MGRQRGRKESASQRQQKAVALRTAGHTFEQIAEECQYSSRATAYRAVQSLLRRRESVAADDLRRLEDARLDSLTRRVYAELEYLPVGVDPAHVARLAGILVRIGESRRRLHGADLVEQPHVVNFEAQARMEELKRLWTERLELARPLRVVDADEEES